MSKTKLPQPYGLRLEMIRGAGYSDHEILKAIERSDASELHKKVDPEVSWDGLFNYAKEHRDALEKAVLDGYQFTFITIGGLKDLLAIRFGKNEEQDYRFGGTYIDRLRMNAADYLLLRDLVPNHWDFSPIRTDPESDRIEFRIQLAE